MFADGSEEGTQYRLRSLLVVADPNAGQNKMTQPSSGPAEQKNPESNAAQQSGGT